MLKYRLLEYNCERDCWIKKISWTRDFYSAKSLKECFSSKIKDHDVTISYLGMRSMPSILRRAGLFNRMIAFVDNETRKVYQFEEVKDSFCKYQIEDIAECVIRLCEAKNILLTACKEVPLYCYYVKRWYSEHGIDIMHGEIENLKGLPYNERLKNKIGDSGLLISYIEHSEKEREKYFKVPLKDAVKYKQLKQEDEEIVSDLLDVLTATNIYQLLEIFRRNTCS